MNLLEVNQSIEAYMNRQAEKMLWSQILNMIFLNAESPFKEINGEKNKKKQMKIFKLAVQFEVWFSISCTV